MKSIIKLISSTVIFACASVQAEPVMNLITINTNDPAGYAAWAKSSAPKLIKANDAVAMGLCSPTSGAQEMGDHYLWTFFDSQVKVWSNDPMNPTVAAEVAKMNVERRVRMWDNWRIVRAAEVSEKGYYYNVYVKTDNPAGYMKAMDTIYAEMKKQGYNVTMQIFMGDTGETAGMLMVSIGSSDRAEVGRMMDARSEGWFQKALAGLDGTREVVRAFSLVCETYAMAEM